MKPEEMCDLERVLVTACNLDRTDRAARHAYIDWLLEQGREEDAAWVRYDLRASDAYNASPRSPLPLLAELEVDRPTVPCRMTWIVCHLPECKDGDNSCFPQTLAATWRLPGGPE